MAGHPEERQNAMTIDPGGPAHVPESPRRCTPIIQLYAGVVDLAPEDLEAAIRAAWALDTCDPVDGDDWSPANPSRGQCGSTALVVHDLLGGDLPAASRWPAEPLR